MSTATAQLLVGEPHPNHGGIIPSHIVFLYENDRPVWLLISLSDNAAPVIRWRPNPSNILNDALLMVVLYIIQDRDSREMAKAAGIDLSDKRIDSNACISDDLRENLTLRARSCNRWPKLIFSVFTDSSLLGSLAALAEYPMDIEVCKPIYTRLHSPWTAEVKESGLLDGRQSDKSFVSKG